MPWKGCTKYNCTPATPHLSTPLPHHHPHHLPTTSPPPPYHLLTTSLRLSAALHTPLHLVDHGAVRAMPQQHSGVNAQLSNYLDSRLAFHLNG